MVGQGKFWFNIKMSEPKFQCVCNANFIAQHVRRQGKRATSKAIKLLNESKQTFAEWMEIIFKYSFGKQTNTQNLNTLSVIHLRNSRGEKRNERV
jgi:hypothetical protein